MKEIFLKFMYRRKSITLKMPSGNVYCVEYHRTPFWTYDKRTLKLFFKDKMNWWHGQVWRVFPNGGRCGFGAWCIHATFPRKQMRKFLKAEASRIEKIINKENDK